MSQVLEELVGGMSVGELARLAGSSVSDVVAKVMGTAPSNGSSRPTTSATAPTQPQKTASPARKIPKGKMSVAAVLDVLKAAKGPVSAQDVRAKVGGTPNQVRASLAKLADAKQIRVTGERRATRYALR